jgi:hypothetical protein
VEDTSWSAWWATSTGWQSFFVMIAGAGVSVEMVRALLHGQLALCRGVRLLPAVDRLNNQA